MGPRRTADRMNDQCGVRCPDLPSDGSGAGYLAATCLTVA